MAAPTSVRITRAEAAVIDAILRAEDHPHPDPALCIARRVNYETTPEYKAWSRAWTLVRLARINLAVIRAQHARRQAVTS